MRANDRRRSVHIAELRREIQTTWSDAERSRRRQIALRRQQRLLRLLSSGADFDLCGERGSAAVPAA